MLIELVLGEREFINLHSNFHFCFSLETLRGKRKEKNKDTNEKKTQWKTQLFFLLCFSHYDFSYVKNNSKNSKSFSSLKSNMSWSFCDAFFIFCISFIKYITYLKYLPNLHKNYNFKPNPFPFGITLENKNKKTKANKKTFIVSAVVK